MSKVEKILLALAAAFSLSACSAYSEQELAAIDHVVTALPNEVVGCTFLGNIDSNYGSFTINGARNILKLKTAQLGGNHVVETNLAVRADYLFPPHNWDTPFVGQDEFFMTGRAYLCPEGKGVSILKPSQQAQEQVGFATKPYKESDNNQGQAN